MIEIGPKSSKIVALEITIWGQYRANYKVAGAPSASVLNAGLWSHTPPCTPLATGELRTILPIWLLFLRRNQKLETGENR